MLVASLVVRFRLEFHHSIAFTYNMKCSPHSTCALSLSSCLEPPEPQHRLRQVSFCLPYSGLAWLGVSFHIPLCHLTDTLCYAQLKPESTTYNNSSVPDLDKPSFNKRIERSEAFRFTAASYQSFEANSLRRLFLSRLHFCGHHRAERER